ncbi:MAG: S41 family peptidase [Myxococcota bacterium]
MTTLHTSRLSRSLVTWLSLALLGACQASEAPANDSQGGDASALVDGGTTSVDAQDATATSEDVDEGVDGQANTAQGAPEAGPSEDTVTIDDSEDEAAPDISTPSDVTQVTDWCEAGLGGAPGTRPFAQDLARAHVAQRLFGPSADWIGADATLVDLLQGDAPLDDALLASYADASLELCRRDAEEASDAEATLSKHGTAVLIVPGTGSVTLPQSAEVVIVDLRHGASEDAVRAALGLAVSGPVTLATRAVRKFHGFPAQNDGWTHYEVFDASLPVTLDGTGGKDRPLVVWTPSALSPEVATLVGALRMLGRASVVGHHVHAAVAESSWSGIGDAGLLWRASTLKSGGTRWPDVIPADLETQDLEEVLASVESLMNPEEVASDATRPELAPYDRGAGMHSETLDRATMRAALLVAYGTLDLFYGYFDLVGRDLDDALLDALVEVDSAEDGDRKAMKHTMGRFMHDLYDGHGFYWDDGSVDWPDGWMALQIQQIEGLPVVRSSLSPGIEAGDTILSVDGVDIIDWYEETMTRYSASSDGYRFVLATDELTEVYGAPQWTLQDPTGAERTVTAMTSEWSDVEAVAWGGTMRESGWLTDLGAPDIYFVNMASAVTPDVSGVVAELASAGDMAGVVLDMRDYPHLDIYEFARTFNPAHFSAPLFGFPTWYGPWEYAVEFEAWEFDPAPHVVDAPVVLMVSNKSVSAAECFSQMVMDLDNVTVVGQQSASTNGTITTFWVPGRFELTFTGMQLTNPDGSDFHTIGVVPEVEVIPTPEEFAAGEDPELNAALEVLGGVD